MKLQISMNMSQDAKVANLIVILMDGLVAKKLFMRKVSPLANARNLPGIWMLMDLRIKEHTQNIAKCAPMIKWTIVLKVDIGAFTLSQVPVYLVELVLKDTVSCITLNTHVLNFVVHRRCTREENG